MLYSFLDFIKAFFMVCLIIATIIVFLLALPKMVEQATSDNQEQPYSGATPDCPLHIDDEAWVVPTSREDVK